MTFSNLFRVFICLLALVAVAFLPSCGDDPCGVDENPDYTRETPGMLLNHLAESFNNKRADWYVECLDEAFVFVLTDRDADSLGLPEEAPWLERSQDTTAVGKMLRDDYVDGIHFSFTQTVDPVAGDEEGTLVLRTTPDILVWIGCPGGGEPIIYVSQESYLDFIVAQDPVNQDLWVIRTMTEIPKSSGLAGSGCPPESVSGACLGTPQSTLGYIKSIFLKAPATNRTVDEALEAYVTSIESKDIGIYGDCLDFDHRFIFTDDVADSLHLPPEAPWWGKSEDIEAMTAMFEHPNVTTIQFDYFAESPDTSRVGENMIVTIRIRPQISLRYEPPGEEPFTFFVNSTFLDFKFIGRGTCSDRWTVLSVEEIPMNPGSDKDVGQALTHSMSMSWGQTKAFFAQ